MTEPRIGILVVTYNAIDHLRSTLSRIPADIYEAVTEIFIIDDCSHDDTYDDAVRYKTDHGLKKLTVMRNESNQGYGGNQKRGYQYAIERELDVVVLLHGDGQYAPESLPELLRPILEGQADFVMGSRMMTKGGALRGGMPLYKFIGNKILTYLQNALTGLGLSEYHSGYRIFRVSSLAKIPFQQFTNTWHFDTQMILSFAGQGFRIQEVPIPTYYGDEISRVNGISYAWKCLLVTLAWAAKKTGRQARS